MNEKLADARQFLAAAGWSLLEYNDAKTVYVVVDPQGVARRSFVPVDRLFDYARGVFDAQEFKND